MSSDHLVLRPYATVEKNVSARGGGRGAAARYMDLAAYISFACSANLLALI